MTINFALTELQTDVVPVSLLFSDRLHLVGQETEIPWVTVPHVYCDRLNRSLMHGGYDNATLIYDYGFNLKQIELDEFKEHVPLDLNRKFVKITIHQEGIEDPDNPGNDRPNIVWVGYITDDRNARGGVQTVIDEVSGLPKEAIYAGQQQLVAVGLEYFLDRTQIDSAVHYNPLVGTKNRSRILRPMTFNGGPSGQIDINYSERGNRSSNNDADGNPVFVEERESTGSLQWSARDIVNYLFAFFSPRGKDPDLIDPEVEGELRPCKFGCPVPNDGGGPPVDIDTLESLYPAIIAQGGTMLQMLRAVIQPTRGLVGWWQYDETTNTHNLYYDSFANLNLSLPTGGTLYANRNQHDWPFDEGPLSDNRMSTPIIKRSERRKYTSVRVRGARRRSVFTVSVASGNMEKNWSTAEENEYKDGAKNLDANYPVGKDYAQLTDAERANRNDALRASDYFQNVYQSFTIPNDWDGRSNNGATPTGTPEDPAFLRYACPAFDSSDSITGSETVRLSGLRFKDRLPLFVGYDYETSETTDFPYTVTPVKKTLSNRPDYLRPFAIVEVTDDGENWQYADKLGPSNHEDGQPVNLDALGLAPYRLYMGQLEPAFTVESTILNHTLGGKGWGTNTGEEPTNFEGQIDFTALRVTLCGEWDAYAEAQFPFPENEGTVDEPLEPLIIMAGDTYRFDYLAENTVIRLDSGKPVIATGGILRDDRKELQDMAYIAWEWYGHERITLDVTVSDIRNAIGLGWLITDFGADDVKILLNTIVSSIDFNTREGSMRIRTELLEMNPNQVRNTSARGLQFI